MAAHDGVILVVGGTGELGSRVVRRLRERNESVRCLVRPGTDDTELQAQGVEIVRGDLTDHSSLPAACSGVSTLVVTASMIVRRLTGAKRPSLHDADEVGVAALVEAAEQAGVSRFGYVSIAGLDRSAAGPLSRAKRHVERRLANSSMRTVIIRPDAFQETHLGAAGRFDLRAGTVAVFGSGNSKRRWVGIDDVAALTVAVMLEPDPPGLVQFGGPELLSKNEAIAVAERLTGRTLKVQRVPLPVARLGAVLLARPNDALASVFGNGANEDLVEADWDDAAFRQRGLTPRSATAWLEEQVAALHTP